MALLDVPDHLVERVERLRGGRPADVTWDELALEQLEFGCAVSEELDAATAGTRASAVLLVQSETDAADLTCTIDGVEYRCGRLDQLADGTIRVMLVDTDEWLTLRFRPDGLLDVVDRQSCTEV